ncbi:hypothetical protein [Methylocapsa sp. S129]|uniref:hypothetical protein n=1 Tax=Methylocapsa sp. S129 TaxID=1641869 RepID=UPI00131E3711|nr:hypothetical protein [Methylocapsa sp. S129]
MQEADLRDKVVASVAAGFAEQIADPQELAPFASAREPEHPIQDFAFRAFRSCGYAMESLANRALLLGPHAMRYCLSRNLKL